jgi:predicted permease
MDIPVLAADFFKVFESSLSLFLLIAVGFFAFKSGMLKKETSRSLTDLLLTVITPCVIISSFDSKASSLDILDIGSFAGTAFIIQGLAVLVGFWGILLFGKASFRKPPSGNTIKNLQQCAMFSNCGFMGLPLIKAVVGSQGVIFGSVFISIFYLFVWTVGVWLMLDKEAAVPDTSVPKRKLNRKLLYKAIVNPGTIGLLFSLPFLFTSWRLPTAIAAPIRLLADLNTPLAMMIIGGYIASVKRKDAISSPGIWVTSLLKLLLIPVISLLIIKVFGLNEVQGMSLLIAISAPTAGNCVLFADKFGKEPSLASRAVAVTTLLSVLTMPLIIMLSRLI